MNTEDVVYKGVTFGVTLARCPEPVVWPFEGNVLVEELYGLLSIWARQYISLSVQEYIDRLGLRDP